MLRTIGNKNDRYCFIGSTTDKRFSWKVYGKSIRELWNNLVDIDVINADKAEDLGFDFEKNPPVEEKDFLSLIKADRGNAYYQSIYESDPDGNKLIYSNWESESE